MKLSPKQIPFSAIIGKNKRAVILRRVATGALNLQVSTFFDSFQKLKLYCISFTLSLTLFYLHYHFLYFAFN